jgi:hypothetical protein
MRGIYLAVAYLSFAADSLGGLVAYTIQMPARDGGHQPPAAIERPPDQPARFRPGPAEVRHDQRDKREGRAAHQPIADGSPTARENLRAIFRRTTHAAYRSQGR